MTSYSQYQEDLKAMELLGCWAITAGRCLEIGAWNPTALSNSRLFIEEGFEAVLVEPSPKPLSDLAREYAKNPKVQVIGAAITVHGGLITMHLTDDALSGETVPEQWKEIGGFYGTVRVPSISMKDFLAEYGGDFAVVSIDVEGVSTDLFVEMLNCGPRPRVVILEHDGRLVELARYYEAAHYRLAHVNGTNCILEWTGAKE